MGVHRLVFITYIPLLSGGERTKVGVEEAFLLAAILPDLGRI